MLESVVAHAQLFQVMRSDVLDRLVEVRGSIDHVYANMADAVVREEFRIFLDRIASYLSTGDVEAYRAFASRWMALRTGAGYSPESSVHSAVAIGDVVVQVAQRHLGHTSECHDFVRTVVRMNFIVARTLVGLLASDLERRNQQLCELQR